MRGVAALEAPDFPAQAAKGDTVQMESPFLLPPGAAFQKMGFAHQNVPHIFFFYLQKRKRAGHGTKEKASGMS